MLAKSPGIEPASVAPFRLNGALVDPEDLSLRRDKTVVRLEPKVMAVLVALAERPGQTWKRGNLINRIWPDGAGGDESLTRSIYNLRKALAQVDIGKALVTIPRLGYRLNAEIKHVDSASQLSAQHAQYAPAPFSIAVLPFSDQSENHDNTSLTQGLVSDLSALLSRIPRFKVAPISSILHHDADQNTLTELGRKLNVRFVVKGSFARQEDDIRIRIELLEIQSGALIWARRYDTKLDRFYDVQDDAVLSIATAVSTEIRTPRTEAMLRNKPFNLSAYERVQEAEALRQNYSRETAQTITTKLEEALSLDPDDPAVAAALAIQLSQNVVSRWAADPDASTAKADALIATAVSKAPHDPDVLTAAGVVATMFHRPSDAIDYLERSIFLNPNDAHAIAVLGWQRCLRDADEDGITLIETAEARAPHHPRFALWATYRATAHLFLLDYNAGLEVSKEAVLRTPNYYQPLLHCAWASAGLGDERQASEYISKAESIESGILPKYIDEMRKWLLNSKYKDANHKVLANLLGCGSKS